MIHEVLASGQQLARGVEAKEEAVRAARRRVAVQSHALRDHAAATERAARVAVVERVRLREAGRAIAPALGRSGARQPQLSAAVQGRNSAREAAAQLTLRVELLGARCAGASALRTRCRLLTELVARMSADLADVESRHAALRSAAAAAASRSRASPEPRPRTGREALEERWLQLAAFTHRQRSSKSSERPEVLDSAPRSTLLITDTEERLSSYDQLYSDIRETFALLE